MLFWGAYLEDYLQLIIAHEDIDSIKKYEISNSLRLKLKLTDALHSLIKSQEALLLGLEETIASKDSIIFSRRMRSINSQSITDVSGYLFLLGESYKNYQPSLTRIVAKSIKGGLRYIPNAILRNSFFQINLITYTQIELEISLPKNGEAVNQQQVFKQYEKISGLTDLEYDYELEESNDRLVESLIETRKFGNENLNEIKELIAPLKLSQNKTDLAFEILKKNIASKYIFNDFFNYE